MPSRTTSAAGAGGRQLGAARLAVMTAARWLPADELKRNADLYRDCGQLHQRCGLLVTRLRRLLLDLAASKPGIPSTGHTAVGDAFDVQELTACVDEVLSVSEALTRVRSAVSAAGAGGSSSAVLAYKSLWWRGRVWQDRVTLLHLVQAIVTEALGHCNPRHDWPGWKDVLRMVTVYNELLNVGSSGDGNVVGVCRNSCATLQYPLRKMSLNRILQLLAQQRAERCCQQLVKGLLVAYRPPASASAATTCVDSPASSTASTVSSPPPPEDDNSSMEIFRALTHHMSPPHGANGFHPGGLTPVASDAACPGGSRGGGASGGLARQINLDGLVRAEDALVACLLQAAVHHAPHLLGTNAFKTSKTTEERRVRGSVRRRAHQYYQQLLWGEVGCVVEHVLLWWGTGTRGSSLGVEPPEQCHRLRARLISLTKSPSMPALCLGALQSLVDSLGVHVSSTSWDALFRRSIVAAGHQHCMNKGDAEEGRRESHAGLPGGAGHQAARQTTKAAVSDEDAARALCGARGPQGTATGRLFTATLADLVDLANLCEPNGGDGPLSAAPTLEEIESLPLVEQIPILHRLDHSVHTTRLWTAARARLLASSWTLAAFFLVSQRDVENCIAELARLKLRDHGDLPRTTSVHVMVCSKMRAKLVSEVKENINKLKRVPEESIAVLSAVCRTVSLATLHMVFPGARYWRQSGPVPEYATSYVEDFLERVLRPVLVASGLLTASVQLTVAGLVLRIMCESWLDHIYTRRIKFSEWGALQLLTDFGAVPTWLCERVSLPADLRASLLRHEVLRRCEGVGRLLLRRPGERVSMSGHNQPGPGPAVPRGQQRAQQRAKDDSTQPAAAGPDMPAEMYVPNQEQWLELRAPRGPVPRARAKAQGLCAATLCCMLPTPS